MKIFVALVILTLQFAYYECCTCMPKHPQAAFCKAHFAIKAIVISDPVTKPLENAEMYVRWGLPVPIFRFYKVMVTKVLKGNVTSNGDNFSYFFETTVRTSNDEATCGVTLKRDTTYVITGRKYNGQLQINKCDWVEEYTKLSKQMRKGIRGDYDCQCEIATCFDGYCTNDDSPCKWYGTENQSMDDCTQKHRACRKIVNQCHWIQHRTSYQSCHKKVTFQKIIP